MAITYNGVTANDIYTESAVCTHQGYGLDLWITMNLTSVAETDTSLNVGYNLRVESKAEFSHEGNGLMLRPYYKLSDKSAVFAETFQGFIQAGTGVYSFYDDHVFTVPKDESVDRLLNFGFLAQGIYVNLYTSYYPDVPAYSLSDVGQYYPFFTSPGNPDPPFTNSVVFSIDGFNDETKITLPSQAPKIWYYTSDGVPHKGTVYYYTSDGVPHKATAVYYYDANGVPHKSTI